MANDTVPSQPIKSPWTARNQLEHQKLKVVRLIELGENEKGRFARVEFEDESSRPLYLLTIEDAWSRLFNTLDYASQWLIRDHFNSRFADLKLPNGLVKKFKHASFISKTVTHRRKHIGASYFDLTLQESPNGRVCGLNIAREFLALAKTSGTCRIVDLAMMSKELSEAKHQRDDERANSAAWEFLKVIDEMIRFAACHTDFNEYIDRLTKDALRSEQFLVELEAKQKSEFVERMKKAREAKRNNSKAATQTEECSA